MTFFLLGKNYSYKSLIVIFFVFLSGSYVSNYAQSPYKAVADNNYPPHIFLDDKNQPDGFDYDVLKLIENESGLSFNLYLMDWNKALSRVYSGDADILVGINKTNERAELFDFTQEYIISKTVIFVNSRNLVISTLPDLYNRNIAVQKGDLAEEYLKTKYPQIKLTIYSNQIEAFNALKNGIVDAMVGSYHVGLYWMNKYSLDDDIKVVGRPLLITPYCIAVRKGNVNLIDKLNRSISRLHESGKLKKVRDKWFDESFYYTLWFEKNNFIKIIKYTGLIGLGIIIVSWIVVFLLKKRISKVVFELKELNRYYKSLIENASDVIIVINNNGIVNYVSPSLIKLLGYPSEEILGKNIYGIIHPLDLQIAVSFFSEKKHNNFVEIRFIDKQGTHKILETSINNLQSDPAIAGLVINARDITGRVKAEKEIQMLAQTIRNISECVCVTDTRNNILFVNEAFLKTYDYSTKEEVLNKNISILHADEIPESSYNEIYHATIRGGWQGETIHKKRNNVVFPVYVSTAIVYDNKEEPVALVGVSTDITERKIAEFELINARDEAEKSNRLKSEFLAQISHEIRTPVNTILSFTSLLKEELELKVDDDLKSSFSIIENGGKRLIRTIDMILNMSEVQAGNFEINLKEINIVKDILNKLVPEFINTAKSKGIELLFESDIEDCKIIGDQYTITQIFQNLIDNAIKYTPSGKIEIKAYKNSRELHVEIKDTGIGISKEYLPYLFEAFSQEETGYTRRFEGNGLGLSLVKKYVELNNASIKVESKKGTGSVFIVSFKILDKILEQN